MDDCDGRQKLGSNMFCEIGPAAACVADNPEHNAPKSPQKHRLESIILFQQIVNQASKLARYSQICSGHVPEDLQIRRNENRLSIGLHKTLCFRKRLSIGLQGECSTNIGCACRQNAASVATVYCHRIFPAPRPLQRPGAASARFAPANRRSGVGGCSVSVSRVNAQRCIKYTLHEEGVASMPPLLRGA